MKLQQWGVRRGRDSAPSAWLISLQDRNLNAVEIGWPFRFGLEGCTLDRSQDIGWKWAFGDGRKIVPERPHRRGADDDTIIAFGVELGVVNQPAQGDRDRIETIAFARSVNFR